MENTSETPNGDYVYQAEIARIHKWLENMPYEKRYKIKTQEQLKVIEEWATVREWDGGLNLNADRTEVYKCEPINLPEKWKGILNRNME